jgi:hypothetical protein
LISAAALTPAAARRLCSRLFALSLLPLLSVAACTSTNFTRTGFEAAPPRQPGEPCQAVVLQRPPSDRQFIELDFCTTSMPGGGVITDKTPAAIKELQDCACQNGGNAIVYFGDSESGIHSGLGYSQQHIKARASVLYVYPKQQ